MKRFNLFPFIVGFLFTVGAHGMPPTSEQVIAVVKEKILQTVATSTFRLVDGSIDLAAYSAVDGARVLLNNTAGLVVGRGPYISFYNVDFKLLKVDGTIVPARTYLVVDDDGKNCISEPIRCSNIYRGFRTEYNVPPTLEDFINSAGH
jgi:hypothetical protein